MVARLHEKMTGWKRMLHPDTRLHVFDRSIGQGIRATKNIPKGTVVWVRDALDLVIHESQRRLLPAEILPELDRLGYQDHNGSWILCWDNAKYMNHSCDPTMRGVGPDAMIAIRDIEEGQELTCDYAECNLEHQLPCKCSSKKCRTKITGSDLLHLHRIWQVAVQRAVLWASQVPQPLVPLAIEPLQLERILAREQPVPLLRDVYFDRDFLTKSSQKRCSSQAAPTTQRQDALSIPSYASLPMQSTETRFLHDGQRGLFAVKKIEKGEVVVVFGGQALTLTEVQKLPPSRRKYALQVEDQVFLYSEHDGPGDWVNHSCDPNVGFEGQVVLVAMRTIEAGEEICFDYAMSDTADYDEFQCTCGTSKCRNFVSKDDWRRPELQDRYQGYFARHILRELQRKKPVESPKTPRKYTIANKTF